MIRPDGVVSATEPFIILFVVVVVSFCVYDLVTRQDEQTLEDAGCVRVSGCDLCSPTHSVYNCSGIELCILNHRLNKGGC